MQICRIICLLDFFCFANVWVWLGGGVGIRSSLASRHETRRGSFSLDAPTLQWDLLPRALSLMTTSG
jgi:hypothetical protein